MESKFADGDAGVLKDTHQKMLPAALCHTWRIEGIKKECIRIKRGETHADMLS